MIILPHLLVLDYLKTECEKLRNAPHELEFLLSSYDLCPIRDTYGTDYIVQSARWFNEHSFHFSLGSRFDVDKIPSIVVTYEGGSENEEFIGDQGHSAQVQIKPRKYAEFSIKDLKDGNLIISASENIKQKVWRGLIVKNSKFSAKITDILPSGDDVELVLSKKAELDKVTLLNWSAVSPVDKKIRQIGSSMDRVTIRVYLTIQGDPELAEMMSLVLRYLMKQSRMFLKNYGLHESTFSHSALAKNSDFEESQVWSVEFTISGLLQDQWIMSETVNPDNYQVNVVAKTTHAEFEEVTVWPK